MIVDVEKWMKGDGELFLKGIGIEAGQVLLDFGCGVGRYSIPAAKIVEKEGTVYAIDKDEQSLEELMTAAESEGLENMVPINSSEDTIPDMPEIGDASVDVVLLYDVLHYVEKREELIGAAHRVLKEHGLLSVYPKHNKSDAPLWALAHLELKDIVEEIEESNFCLEWSFFETLIHDDSYNEGHILNFRKSDL